MSPDLQAMQDNRENQIWLIENLTFNLTRTAFSPIYAGKLPMEGGGKKEWMKNTY
jgi:hypothetical protein